MSSGYVIAIDAGTTSVRCIAFDEHGSLRARTGREFTQHFPRPGWVEHDPDEIWSVTAATLAELVVGLEGPVAAIGITNQRETVVAWDRRTGRPLAPAIVWQDRRTAERCGELEQAGHLPLVRERTGLVLDAYFSGTKVEWLLRNGLPNDADLAVGTVDAWLMWCLTGGRVHATDPSNASRTMLFGLRSLAWEPELCDLLSVPMRALPEVRPSSGRFGVTREIPGVPDGLPVSGVAGDQQAALFGQACFSPGEVKNTYGTGSFVLLNIGSEVPEPAPGILTTVAWQLPGAPATYALEAAIFVTGAAIQWLRDGLQIIEAASETGQLAASVADTGGVYIVPAFVGLGCPWWDPYARGTITGVTRGTTRAHLARAVVEAMAYQSRDAIEAMAAHTSHPLRSLRVDGGASAMDLLLQLQADQLQVPVARPRNQETTALGAAYLAGLAEGVWDSTDDLRSQWKLDLEALPGDRAVADGLHAGWRRAVERSLAWATPD
ncbi:MAG TPA: glycerol kinase GlpK [Acidimicrobiales bacterium]